MREQPLRLELGELGADRRGAPREVGVGRERPRRDRLAGRGVALGDLAQDRLLSGCSSIATDFTRPRSAPSTSGAAPQSSSSAVAPRITLRPSCVAVALTVHAVAVAGADASS